MKPISVTWEVGQDIHGRQVRLVYESGIKPGWTIHVLAASQRDEDARIFGLTGDVILAMAEAVRKKQGWKNAE